jgi:hypothetical protein
MADITVLNLTLEKNMPNDNSTATDHLDLSPGPWRTTGAPNYQNVIDGNGAPVCSVAAGIYGETNARALAEARRAALAVRDALRVINDLVDGNRSGAGEINRIVDELASITVSVFGNETIPFARQEAETADVGDALASPPPAPARRGRGKAKPADGE